MSTRDNDLSPRRSQMRLVIHVHCRCSGSDSELIQRGQDEAQSMIYSDAAAGRCRLPSDAKAHKRAINAFESNQLRHTHTDGQDLGII